MTKPHMTLPNGDVLYEGDYAVTLGGEKVGPLNFRGGDFQNMQWASAFNTYTDHGSVYNTSEDHGDLVAKWTDQDETPILWRDMTPEQKGALLLAHHEGKVIEWIDPEQEGDEWDTYLFDIGVPEFAYRIKPGKPKAETVSIVGRHQEGEWSFGSGKPWKADTHRITFNLIDGKPDCDSVKMEPINE